MINVKFNGNVERQKFYHQLKRFIQQIQFCWYTIICTHSVQRGNHDINTLYPNFTFLCRLKQTQKKALLFVIVSTYCKINFLYQQRNEIIGPQKTWRPCGSSCRGRFDQLMETPYLKKQQYDLCLKLNHDYLSIFRIQSNLFICFFSIRQIASLTVLIIIN